MFRMGSKSNRAPAQKRSEPPSAKAGPDLGARVRDLCRTRNLTLRRLSMMTEIPIATLSKVQNNLATLSYVQLTKLASGLGLELSDLFTSSTVNVRAGRRAVTRKGAGPREASRWYDFEMLCGDLANKKMNVAIMESRARTRDEAGGLISHEGEELAYVLEGAIEVHSEDYLPTRLDAGDSIYMDSTSGHVYVNVSEAPISRVLAVTSTASTNPGNVFTG